MDNNKITFTSDRGAYILKPLKVYPVIYCFAHRINNVLKLTFYQTAQNNKKRVLIASSTPAKKQPKKLSHICDSSSDSSSSEDDTIAPSPSKHGEANTALSDLPPKPEEVLKTITTNKKLVKCVKLAGLNKNIEERGGVALKQECAVRRLSMSNMLESVDASIEHIRFILLSKSSKSQCYFKLNNINIDALKDLIGLLSEFKNLSSLAQTGARPSLYMAYICINKRGRHLSSTDVNADGENIDIYDRHEGIDFFRKRLIQLLKCMLTFDDKHLATAILHPLYRKLTFASTYSKSIAYLYIRKQLNDILGLSEQVHRTNSKPLKKSTSPWRINSPILMITAVLMILAQQQ
ncbi:unnamed protein product [Rotaria socialis]|uniref:Uncharacterized protein n=1 Tax=Rotaria socialis TaxID=392032 RepID=A0A819V0E0_9BILA|nr:unnamed protein product [Rotaria socialis]CAF4097513.1 unnamed protein product [Rotaria socialis]